MQQQTTIRVEKRLLDRIKDLAKDRQCSMNRMIIYLLEESILSYYQKEYECRKIIITVINTAFFMQERKIK